MHSCLHSSLSLTRDPAAGRRKCRPDRGIRKGVRRFARKSAARVPSSAQPGLRKMQLMSVTPSDALPVRLLALGERALSPIANAVLCAFLLAPGGDLWSPESEPRPDRVSSPRWLWALAVYAALLMLRVYDEHKGLRDRSKESSRARCSAALITLGH